MADIKIFCLETQDFLRSVLGLLAQEMIISLVAKNVIQIHRLKLLLWSYYYKRGEKW